ncbi:xanthine dehydrogenase accessory protein XdhC [Mesorhizobium sp. CAU 1741]|uniref:xanthine dehydrogenase accessory protein XdhC n=1 Tax=Mesorhizobium sp. CAU 1741 TaxID=3140366 RepID=UPI00325A634E
MTSATLRLRSFLDVSPSVAVVDVQEALGSTPREIGAWMLVSPDAIFGTIGGGQLEFMAIARAREMMREAVGSDVLDVPLGPEIGQCCGGRVKIAIAVVDQNLRATLPKRIDREEASQPHVYLFGAGHVGHALAEAFALLPVSVTVVETRAEALDGMPDSVDTVLTPVPEETVRGAPAGSGFIVLTHDHALDFLIVAEALRRSDALYVGMIGSRTKMATFKSWYLREAAGNEADAARLVCPIGGAGLKDKRPAVIAALAAAEVLRALLPAG